MSDQPTITAPSFFRRKVAGVPVLYLAVGFVVVLVVIAWRMQSTVTAVGKAEMSADDPFRADENIRTEDALPPMPIGTVVAPPPADNGGNASIADNEEWMRRGVAHLISQGANPGDAQLALQAYLQGNELSFQQGQMRDSVIREFGIPPFPVDVGGTAPDIGRTQGPLPRAHIVKSVNEDTALELARIYYNRSDDFAVKAVSDANNGRQSYNVGETVTVPVLPTPATTAKPAVPATRIRAVHIVQKGETLSMIAQKYYGHSGESWWRPISRHNHLPNPHRLVAGQRLEIPYHWTQV